MTCPGYILTLLRQGNNVHGSCKSHACRHHSCSCEVGGSKITSRATTGSHGHVTWLIDLKIWFKSAICCGRIIADKNSGEKMHT